MLAALYSEFFLQNLIWGGISILPFAKYRTFRIFYLEQAKLKSYVYESLGEKGDLRY
jgi:hypothetical protein